MRRAPGWIRLAGIALELTALAYAAYVLMGRKRVGIAAFAPLESARSDSAAPDDRFDAPPPPAPSPIQFITESADEGARFFRAVDETAQLIAAFYSDGRVRLADTRHRFAGMLQSGHADLLELDSNQWSELFVNRTPAGRMQLELRGGPYDARVLLCEPLENLRMTT